MASDAPRDQLTNVSDSIVSTKCKNVLKKGPWTTAEDMILIECVKKHGEGNWNAVQRNTGLMRCGKSCRLRWANHLRPNLKKGAFSADEEKLIIELHAKLGNKWARMAAQLPGRTDNEIKNYWNTRLKRRQRLGLPIYPEDIVPQKKESMSLPSLLLPSQPQNSNPLPFYEPINSPSSITPTQINPNPNNSQYSDQQLKLYQADNGSLRLQLGSPDVSPFFNQRLCNRPLAGIPSTLLGYNSMENNGLDHGMFGPPLIQPNAMQAPVPLGKPIVPETSNQDSQEIEVELGFPWCRNTGLLGDLLRGSQPFKAEEKPEIQFSHDVHQKGEEFGYVNVNGTENGNRNHKDEGGQENGHGCVDDDLLNHLLDNFPMSVPIPDWNDVHGDELVTAVMQADSVANIQDWSIAWNNMPTIYST